MPLCNSRVCNLRGSSVQHARHYGRGGRCFSQGNEVVRGDKQRVWETRSGQLQACLKLESSLMRWFSLLQPPLVSVYLATVVGFDYVLILLLRNGGLLTVENKET